MRSKLLFIVTLALLAACTDDASLPTYDLRGSTMGTTFNITVVAPRADVDLDGLQAEIYENLEHIENLASTYRASSELSMLNTNPSTDWIDVSQEFCDMIAAAQEVSVVSGGAFDVTVGPLVNLWGFGPGDLKPGLPTSDEVSAAKENVGMRKLTTDCGQSRLRKAIASIYVDLSGWAKGYAVDEVAKLLDHHRLHNYLIEIGGELRMRGHNSANRKFAIAIENPLLSGGSGYKIVRLSNTAVATSGDYRNFFEQSGHRYSHTIDPRTGHPVDHALTGVTVISTSTAYADAMATALLVLGPDDGLALAEELGLAGLFLVRADSGIEEISTAKFKELTRS